MTDVRGLIAELEAGYSGSPWHGPSLQDNLQSVSVVQASRRIGSGHTIWELVLHLAAWRGEITRRLQGHEAGTPPEGDFPTASHTGSAMESEWRRALASLDDAQRELLAAVRELTEDDLRNAVLDHREDPSGQGATREATLLGLLQHDAYHSGQIALLKRSSAD